MKAAQVKTGKEVRSEMEASGISLRDWCRAQDVSYDIARAVIAGRVKAKRGQGHLIAVALGMKTGNVVPAKLYKPLPQKAKASLKVVRS